MAFFNGNSVPRRIVVHIIIVAGFLIPIWIAAKQLQSSAKTFAEDWGRRLNPITCDGDDLRELPIAFEATEQQRKRLGGQFHEIQQRLDHHFTQLVVFYRNYFATIIMTGVLASVAAIALLFITTAGWQNASEYARTIFLVATAAATYCAAFPGIFEQQQNIDDNKTLYINYVALANEMCSYSATGEDLTGDPASATVFIHHVDSELQKMNKIAIGFNATKTPNFAQVFNEALGRGGEGSQGNKTGEKKPAKKPNNAGSKANP